MDQMIPKYMKNEESIDISLREVVAPLFRRKRLLLVTFLSVVALALVFSQVMPAPYKAHMSVLVKRDRLDPLVSPGATLQTVTGTPDITEEETNSEVELLQSHDVLQQVVLASGLNKPGKKTFFGSIISAVISAVTPRQTDAEKTEHAVAKLAKKLKVETSTKSNVIDVTYSSKDPQQAYDVMHALAALYMQKHLDVLRPAGAGDFFSAEADKYKAALEDAENRLRDFSHSAGLSAPDVERTDLAQQVALTTGQLTTARQAVAADEEHVRSDRAQLKDIPERTTTLQSTGPADKLIQDLTTQLVVAQTKRTQLALKYDDQYPLVKEADQEIALTKEAIAQAESRKYLTETTDKDLTHEAVRQDLAKTEADLAAQRAGVIALQSGLQNMQTQMVNLDQKALQQQDLQREVKINEDSYLLYQQKREEARTSDALDKTRIANVAIADPPALPVLPIYGFGLFLFIALAGSAVLSIGSVYIVDYLDRSFHTPAQVMEVLDIPVVVAMAKRTA
jgi:uncharacterized protein involved in exopolysaccharide biosynthesis